MKIYSWKNRMYIALSCLLFIILWQCAAVYINNQIYLPTVEDVIFQIKYILTDINFEKIICSSLYRSILSYIMALVIAMVLGILSVLYPFFEYIFVPLNSFAKTIPTMVLVVLALVWFDKDKAPFVVGFAITFPILYEGIRSSIINIDKKIIEMAKIYDVNLMDTILKIYIPVMKFYLLSIFVSTFSLTFKVVIAGEVHGQPKYGIGSQIQIEKMNFNTPGIFAWIMIIIIMSIAFEVLNKILNKKIYRWKSAS